MTSHSPTDVYFGWFDLETTGLEHDDHLLEVAMILTDANLDELARYHTLVRPKPSTFARLMANEVVHKMHLKSGLFAELDAADPASLPTYDDVERELLELISAQVPDGAVIHIAGGGVANFDKPFMMVNLPSLVSRFHYRPIDTSIFTGEYEAAVGDRRAFPKKASADKKHRALDDLEDDLGVGRAQWRFLRRAYELIQRADAPTMGGVDRILAGASLIEAAGNGPDGTSELVTEQSLTDALAGVTAIARHLAEKLAEEQGVSVSNVMNTVRRTLLGTPA